MRLVLFLDFDGVLFLDFDGVLNSTAWYVKRREAGGIPITAPFGVSDDLDPSALEQLKRIVDTVQNLEIVISSTWRLNTPLPDLRALLTPFGIPARSIVSKTPRFPGEIRGKEIAAWLDYEKHWGPIGFVILDDDTDMGDLMKFLVWCDHSEGLTEEKANHVIGRFHALVGAIS